MCFYILLALHLHFPLLPYLRIRTIIQLAQHFPNAQKENKEMKKKATIQDIADALGISRNTVSKAINNSGGLAESTREKILQKAVEMGYKQFS